MVVPVVNQWLVLGWGERYKYNEQFLSTISNFQVSLLFANGVPILA